MYYKTPQSAYIHPCTTRHMHLYFVCIRVYFCKMATRITSSELEQFTVATVELTGRVLGAGAYGSVEEVEIPGATVAAKKLHQQLVNLGSPQQVAQHCCFSSHFRLRNEFTDRTSLYLLSVHPWLHIVPHPIPSLWQSSSIYS